MGVRPSLPATGQIVITLLPYVCARCQALAKHFIHISLNSYGNFMGKTIFIIPI